MCSLPAAKKVTIAFLFRPSSIISFCRRHAAISMLPAYTLYIMQINLTALRWFVTPIVGIGADGRSNERHAMMPFV